MNSEPSQRVNPFFETWNTPHQTIPFAEISIDDYEEAFLEGIRRDKELVERITSNPEEPTFGNTISVVVEDKPEGYYRLLDRVSTVFSCMLSAETCDELEQLAQKMSPLLTQHANDVMFNKKLFDRTRYVYEHQEGLTDEEQMLLKTDYEAFVRRGALLDEAGQNRLRALSEEASLLTLQFSQNLLKEKKAFQLHITDREQLDGLPPTAIEAAAGAAREQELQGWIFTLDYPSMSPFMQYSTQRQLREKMYKANATLCTHEGSENNLEICRRLVNIRRETAQLLGYNTFADYILERRMASSVGNVYNLLHELMNAYRPTAQREHEEIVVMARKMEGDDFQMEPWDVAYYTHKLEMERFNLDAEMLRPYFELSKVIDGVFGLAHRLYGISFREAPQIPVYHPDVKAYEVFDRDGAYLAVFYADFHPRKGKQGGAWMTEFQGQWIDHKGRNIRPHVSVVMNLSKPTDNRPALLTLGEVSTFLHEFGHALHGMFANTRFESLSGTNVWWDFVELPSQFMENYALERDFIDTFAEHYQTHEPLPDELFRRLMDKRHFLSALACMRQVRLGLIDMAYYTLTDELTGDIIAFEKQAQRPALIGKEVPYSCMTTQFSHIMAGGYAAGYYSYKWAEVLDADAFSLFQQNGIFDKATAQSFRDNILSRGGTEHPMALYKRFRGQEPTIDALLRRDGIRTEAENGK